jgi:hypothetical protein
MESSIGKDQRVVGSDMETALGTGGEQGDDLELMR